MESDSQLLDGDIEMIDVVSSPLQVEDDPIKDIKHFFSEPYTKDGQKHRDCRQCP